MRASPMVPSLFYEYRLSFCVFVAALLVGPEVVSHTLMHMGPPGLMLSFALVEGERGSREASGVWSWIAGNRRGNRSTTQQYSTQVDTKTSTVPYDSPLQVAGWLLR